MNRTTVSIIVTYCKDNINSWTYAALVTYCKNKCLVRMAKVPKPGLQTVYTVKFRWYNRKFMQCSQLADANRCVAGFWGQPARGLTLGS